MRVAALTAWGEQGDPEEHVLASILAAVVEDPAPEVRCTAAVTAGRLAGAEEALRGEVGRVLRAELASADAILRKALEAGLRLLDADG